MCVKLSVSRYDFIYYFQYCILHKMNLLLLVMKFATVYINVQYGNTISLITYTIIKFLNCFDTIRW